MGRIRVAIIIISQSVAINALVLIPSHIVHRAPCEYAALLPYGYFYRENNA